MKIRVALTIEVDLEAWEEIYGVPPREARADVKLFVLGCVQGSAAANEGAITAVKPVEVS